MRGIATVLTIAFVFASSALLVDPVAGQTKPEPADYSQPAPNAVLHGRVTGPGGVPVVGASVSASNYGSPPPATEPGSGSSTEPASGSSTPSSGSADASIACYDCYYGGYNSSVTDSDGRYSMGVWAGENRVDVYHADFVHFAATVSVASGQDAQRDIELKAFPARTAHVEGKVLDAKTGKAVPNVQININNPEFGRNACSSPEGSQSGGGSSGSAEGETRIVAPGYPYYQECPIATSSEGSFDGMVTPGYSIVTVYAYADCATSSDVDGSSSTSCGPEYLSWSRTLVLPANETTRLDVRLVSRAAPDATVSGYLVDAETGLAIPGGSISFSNLESYAYGWATTDGDGSYQLRLRSGYHEVSVYAPGHFPWQGVLQVKAGSSDFDVKLTPGEQSYDYGCYDICLMRSGVAEDSAVGAPSPMAPGGTVTSDAGLDQDADGNAPSAELYEGSGGGLGPYDASKRAGAASNEDAVVEPSDKGAPGLGLVASLAALGAVVLVLRRRVA